MRGIIVADLGFGDAGKGTVTDALCRSLGARLVVRHNGGAQAGHNVVESGRHHTFSQFGAGTFCPGVRTYLSRYMVLHPGGLLEEACVLGRKGVPDALERLSIDPQAKVITPFHQAVNRLREVLRGEARHGSCGLGVGETVHHSLEHPRQAVLAQDFHSPGTLRRKLLGIQQHYWQEFADRREALVRDPLAAPELAVLESAAVGENFIELTQRLVSRVQDFSPPEGTVIFEGAQGVLLDEWRGFHPYTTWSTCTFDNALELLKEWGGEAFRLGVTRTYSTRHGAGPFPTEDPQLRAKEPHNAWGPWQEGFRQGWLDMVLLRYAVEACGGLDGLALTHLDRLAPGFKMAHAYEEMDRVDLGTSQDLDHQERLGQALEKVHPIYRRVDSPEAVKDLLSEVVQAPLVIKSFGPKPDDKWLDEGWLRTMNSQPKLRCEIA